MENGTSSCVKWLWLLSGVIGLLSSWTLINNLVVPGKVVKVSSLQKIGSIDIDWRDCQNEAQATGDTMALLGQEAELYYHTGTNGSSFQNANYRSKSTAKEKYRIWKKNWMLRTRCYTGLLGCVIVAFLHFSLKYWPQHHWHIGRKLIIILEHWVLVAVVPVFTTRVTNGLIKPQYVYQCLAKEAYVPCCDVNENLDMNNPN